MAYQGVSTWRSRGRGGPEDGHGVKHGGTGTAVNSNHLTHAQITLRILARTQSTYQNGFWHLKPRTPALHTNSVDEEDCHKHIRTHQPNPSVLVAAEMLSGQNCVTLSAKNVSTSKRRLPI